MSRRACVSELCVLALGHPSLGFTWLRVLCRLTGRRWGWRGEQCRVYGRRSEHCGSQTPARQVLLS